jgi:hypothetical protein
MQSCNSDPVPNCAFIEIAERSTASIVVRMGTNYPALSATTVKRISFRYPTGLTSVFDLPTNVHDAPTSEGSERSDS